MPRTGTTSIHCKCGALVFLCEDERSATAFRAAIQTDTLGPPWPKIQAVCDSPDLGACAQCGQPLSRGRRLRRAMPIGGKRAAA